MNCFNMTIWLSYYKLSDGLQYALVTEEQDTKVWVPVFVNVWNEVDKIQVCF